MSDQMRREGMYMYADKIPILNKENTLSFDEYQRRVADTAIYPNVGNNIYYPALGLGGEVGEVLNKIKKIMRGDYTLEEKQAEIASELNDCMWYIAQLATELKVDLSKVCMDNLNKLNKRKEQNLLQGDGDNR